MLTVHTCPTITLEKLCKEFEFPKTFTESVILFGAQAQIRIRGLTDPDGKSENENLSADLEQAQNDLDRLAATLADKLTEIETLEAEIERLKESALEGRVESALTA